MKQLKNNIGTMGIIDALKGISSIGIVIYHYGHFSQIGLTDPPFSEIFDYIYVYGYYLVDLFFIISGFLFYKAFSLKIANCEIDFKQFIMQRYIKLFPLFLVTTGVTAVGQWIILYHTGSTFMHGADLYSLLLNMIGLQYVGLDNGLSFNGPAWYISVLMLCYVAYFFICKYQCSWAYTFTLFFLIMYKCNLSVPMMTQHVFRGLLGFSMGRLCFYIWLTVKGRYIRNISVTIMAFTFVLWLLFKHKQIDILGDKFLYFLLVFWPSLFLFCIVSEITDKILSNKLFLWFGKISYSLFLWHFPIEVFFVIVNHFANYRIDFNKPEIWEIRLLLSITIAVVSFYFIEPALDKFVKKILRGSFICENDFREQGVCITHALKGKRDEDKRK